MDVAVLNVSSVVTDAEIAQWLPALQRQLVRDVEPEWGRVVQLVQVPTGQKAPGAIAWCGVFDDADQPGALGYHDETPTGRPLGKVFAKTDLEEGQRVSVTLSHELVEMAVDPDINLVAIDPDGTEGYAVEVCDPVEADDDGYDLAGGDGSPVRVSNFVTRAWFGPGYVGVRYDHAGLLTGPRSLRPGGYISVLTLGSDAGWSQRTDAHVSARACRLRMGSRRQRRHLGRAKWVRSTVAVA